jgi:hypothetical protein
MRKERSRTRKEGKLRSAARGLRGRAVLGLKAQGHAAGDKRVPLAADLDCIVGVGRLQRGETTGLGSAGERNRRRREEDSGERRDDDLRPAAHG